ncbi:cleavage stimulation factor subunit 2-like [Babylonia areolata]|uniref:cleavage stimulation factor subunit 2-like n=1 Tax=Babylonia areolata TaxID=304850 RepID=UPI003FD58D12
MAFQPGVSMQSGPPGLPPFPSQILPAATAGERASRSVFVGNIPYDATEEQLKTIFNQVGQVTSFRLVYDRETGKPKGYGFCEYTDQETAMSAMRNLNNYDFNGRPLRVGYAAGENKDEMKGIQPAGAMVIESPFGEAVEPEKAPEAISKAVASLPPEQMFELMKQMKLCIQNNPNEARNMLLQNPQLAYALLQAQIVMKIVDPQVAMAMLYRDDSQPLAPAPAPTTTPAPVAPPVAARPPAAVAATPTVPAVTAPAARLFPSASPGPSQPVTQPLPGAALPTVRPEARPLAPGGPPATPGASEPLISAQDQEKAALIMQVLQLTDQQIAMLPPEQRQSILILKEQLSKNQ